MASSSSWPKHGVAGAADEPGYVFALLNEGREAGASLPHSHSQLAWLPSPPPRRKRPRGGAGVGERRGRRSLPVGKPRSLRDRDRAGRAGAEALRASELARPALELLADIVRRLHAPEGPLPLNAWLEHDEDDWRLVLFPRLTILAGLELGAGIYVNTLPPEEAAARLRSA